MTDPEQRLADLDEELAAAGAVFVAAIADLEPMVARLADLEGRHRAAGNAAGIHHHRRSARELAVEVLEGRLDALRPYLPFGTRESADLAAEQLCAQQAL